jgi:hypothetical protein
MEVRLISLCGDLICPFNLIQRLTTSIKPRRSVCYTRKGIRILQFGILLCIRSYCIEPQDLIILSCTDIVPFYPLSYDP